MFFRSKKPKDTNKAVEAEPCKKRSGLLTGIIVGGAVGSVVSLLFAPDKGSRTRKKVAKQGKKLMTEGQTKAEAFLDKYRERIDKNLKR